MRDIHFIRCLENDLEGETVEICRYTNMHPLSSGIEVADVRIKLDNGRFFFIPVDLPLSEETLNYVSEKYINYLLERESP